MEIGLSDGRDYFAKTYSCADMAIFGWAAIYGWSGITIDAFPLVNAWLHRMAQRPAVKKGILKYNLGMDVPDKNMLIENDFQVDEAGAKEVAKEASKWILQK